MTTTQKRGMLNRVAPPFAYTGKKDPSKSQKDAHPSRLVRHVRGTLVYGAEQLLLGDPEVGGAAVLQRRAAVLVARPAVDLTS